MNRAIKIAFHCSWASGNKHAFSIRGEESARLQVVPVSTASNEVRANDMEVYAPMNENISDADLVVDVGDLFTEASSKYPPEKRAHASSEPSIFMDYKNGALATRMADYYRGFVFTWHPQLLHLPQRRSFHFGHSWVTWQPSSPKKLGIGAIFTGKGNPKAEGYALRRMVEDAEQSISVPGMVYGPRGKWKGSQFQYPLPSKRESLEWMFHVSIENHAEAGYFTEKLMDPIMEGCVPIYYGDPEIGKVFAVRDMGTTIAAGMCIAIKAKQMR